jgi:hypothetical protein
MLTTSYLFGMIRNMKDKTQDQPVTKKDFQEAMNKIDDRFSSHDKKFKSMDEHFESVAEHFESVDKHFESVDKHFESVDKHFESVDKHFESVDKHFESVDKQLASINQAIQNLAIKSIKHDERFDNIEKNMATKNDINRIVNMIDTFAHKNEDCERKGIVNTDRIKNLEPKVENHEIRIGKLETAQPAGK